MNQPLNSQEGLTARQIFDKLLKGEQVVIPTIESDVIAQLKNHLQVIKSRDKKVFKSLGLDFTSAVIATVEVPVVINEAEKKIIPAHTIFKLNAPKLRKRYPVSFTIKTP